MPLKNLLISINKFYIKMYLPIYNQEKINIMSISQRFDKRKNFDKSKRKKKGTIRYKVGSGLEFFADVTYFYDYGTRNDYTTAEKLGSVLWKLFRCKSTISSEILSNFALVSYPVFP